MQFAMNKSNSPNKRAAACIPAGSITIEAALIIPIFLFAALCLIYVLEIHAIQTTIRMAAHTAAKEVAQQMAVLPDIETGLFHNNLIRAAEPEKLNRSSIVNGSKGIRCWKTKVNALDQLEVCIEYKIALPFPDFVEAHLECQEIFLVKCWTGYRKGNADDRSSENTVVFVTEQGSVYHTDLECSYLKLSTQFVPGDLLENLRNKDGSRYTACAGCISGHFHSGGGYYVTDYGECYHSSLNCSGLKRTIYSITMEEAAGKGGCSKCTKQHNLS